ncbi:MAG: UDP-N-acetylbacillosamine transaminase [Sulfuricurvum sp.]|uniref:UDP-N-acetylbacillosamine transaminase n=1 Tax=Sulfuricurvum sp. TaxID=2025608 RepID=UPI002725AAA4|nr:UDP-N-acetylbacillosamine transaminase [Sulfuricurvum sp.]MDO9056565.1 UDP-N-acetylbacillosamine transaminase [Sulfuricurvum sp.]MDP3292522.1 UDP-N-acetylbacillosamine transaminase [Sulfuricurvum sp.]
MNKRIFLSPPHMGGNELSYIQEAFESNYIAPLGHNVDTFEAQIKSYTGAKYALALTSGTAAIHLALRVLGIKEGDEVMASTFTFIGSIAPILYERCTPFFIDSDTASWNLDPNLLEEELSHRASTGKKQPKALILTHLYGQCADVKRIATICEHYGVHLIEDAAESLGATYEGKQSGTFGKMGIYSFNGNKIITTSGGGMLVSDDEALISHARHLSTQARDNAPHYEHTEYGYNYRMSNIVAGIGRGQMEVLPERIERRREIFEYYRKAFSEVPEISFMPELKGSLGNRWLTTLILPEHLSPERIRLSLEEQNIESRPLWKPMHAQPLFHGTKGRLNGVSDMLFQRGICLPSGSSLSTDELEKITFHLKAVMAHN